MAPRPVKNVLSLVVVLLAGCAPATREAALADRARRGEPLCSWNGVRWDDRGLLLVPGTDAPLGRALGRWRGERWVGATFSGSLRAAGPAFLLEGAWRGPGALFRVELEADREPAFSAWQPQRLGAAGLLLKGGRVRVLDAREGRVLVAPPAQSLRHFDPADPPALDVTCADLTFTAARAESGDAARRLLVRGGFPESAEERWLAAGAEVPAREAPGGPVIGRFLAPRAPVRAFAVESRGDDVRLVVPEPLGVLWAGWVSAAQLSSPVEPELAAWSAAADERDDAGGDLRRCDEPLTLSVEFAERQVVVGTLDPRTPFLPRARRGTLLAIEPALDWFEPSPGVELLVNPRAASCPRWEQAAP